MTEREAQIFSITAENSSRKIKNELAKHNGWHTYPEDPEPVIKTPYALCHEEKRIKKKKCLSQRDGMREFLKTTNKRKPIQGREEKERKKEKKKLEILSRYPVFSPSPARSVAGLDFDLS